MPTPTDAQLTDYHRRVLRDTRIDFERLIKIIDNDRISPLARVIACTAAANSIAVFGQEYLRLLPRDRARREQFTAAADEASPLGESIWRDRTGNAI